MILYDDINKMINKEEGFDVEFKESVAGLKSEDIVAFANSRNGGTILVGVRDSKTEDGRQLGTIVGCNISDNDKLSILNKANSCRPAVNLDISVFDLPEGSIYVISIPSGDFKPYCTESGTYRIRGDGQKRALYPNELLSLFMESERDKFVTSFRDATQTLERKLLETEEQIKNETNKIMNKFKNFEDDINTSLENISSSAESAESNSDSIESTISGMEDTLDDLWSLLSFSQQFLPRVYINGDPTKDSLTLVREIFSRYVIKIKTPRYSTNTIQFNRQVRILKCLFPELKLQVIKELCEEMVNERIQTLFSRINEG
ncbi:AlbA family DNA-binding domain-containing protein [Paenibacillus alkalitolerans]|uniref:AlbA family DNA-binding domain-containing protein n=1 Tax=Paenibacillus alkalitolerans TaxID=2799335 RepID=UPI0018F7C561|nr:ATP-binding protein [Paenibacillus alkalitolerans]